MKSSPKKIDKTQSEIIEKKSTPKWFFVVLVFIPFAFFIALELSLRFFNYGQEIPQWIDARRGKYIINPEVASRYFYQVKNIPTTIEDVFDQKKKANSFRIFVLGESSTAGFPYLPMGSFSRYIRRRLELTYPNTVIEVVNLSLSAVNTYTILDLLPGVLEQKPDLILIYTGHNEYYGALGVGSMESIGSSPSLVRFVLKLKEYKTVQLIKNILSWAMSKFASESVNDSPGTLMSRMAKDQYIELNSSKFEKGLEQFEMNMRDILKLTKESNVPIILGKVVCNLKDQKPFVSIPSDEFPPADKIYEEAIVKFKNGSFKAADSLFILAKELDALRFRAPNKINEIIEKLCNEHNVKCVPVDSYFIAESPNGIVGNNLMTDHLHPNLKGYQIMGKAYYEAMSQNGFLPKNEKPKISFSEQDRITRQNFVFSDLDSTIGNCRILLLANDWPFIDKSQRKPTELLFTPKNFLDSIAFRFMMNKITWADAHVAAANRYLALNNITGFLKHMDILIYQYPIVVEYYDQVSLALMERELFDPALKYLQARYKIEPNDYSTKWLGNIALYKGDYDNAISFLSKSLDLNSNDAQVLYNLAGAYAQKKIYNMALNTINKCLAVDPNYPQANNLKQQLIRVVNR
ncbi:MAG: tetratricopeptide repeat protein [Ignavibacteriaceae bacterium]|nr:tetratricopeptide repeat protein [Ignavibacteriaceae bacterium]